MSRVTVDYSSNTRVKVIRKTIGLTIREDLISKARDCGINISKLAENALIQTLEPNTQRFSLGIDSLFSKREGVRAGSSVWYERLTCTQEVGGSNPPQSTTTNPRHFERLQRYLHFRKSLFSLKSQTNSKPVSINSTASRSECATLAVNSSSNLINFYTTPKCHS
jgi:hypothetical protein